MGDMMNKLKKTAALAVMVGGMALSGGIAHGDDTQSIGSFCAAKSSDAIGNLQALQCDQDFDAGTAFGVVPVVPLP
jgi:hypothetical protein